MIMGWSRVCCVELVRRADTTGSSSGLTAATSQGHWLNGINYVFAGHTLGERPGPPELYTPEGRADYRAMANTSNFEDGIDQVEPEGLQATIALRCTEESPADCHRALLLGHQFHHRAHDVRHIPDDRPDPQCQPSSGGIDRCGDTVLTTPTCPWMPTQPTTAYRRRT